MSSANLAQQVYPEILRTIVAATAPAAYSPAATVGAPLLHPARMYYLVNGTNQLLVFSWDGVNDHFVVPAGSYILLDITANRTAVGGAFMVSQGITTYVRYLTGLAPTTGSVYLTSFYGFTGLGMY